MSRSHRRRTGRSRMPGWDALVNAVDAGYNYSGSAPLRKDIRDALANVWTSLAPERRKATSNFARDQRHHSPRATVGAILAYALSTASTAEGCIYANAPFSQPNSDISPRTDALRSEIGLAYAGPDDEPLRSQIYGALSPFWTTISDGRRQRLLNLIREQRHAVIKASAKHLAECAEQITWDRPSNPPSVGAVHAFAAGHTQGAALVQPPAGSWGEGPAWYGPDQTASEHLVPTTMGPAATAGHPGARQWQPQWQPQSQYDNPLPLPTGTWVPAPSYSTVPPSTYPGSSSHVHAGTGGPFNFNPDAVNPNFNHTGWSIPGNDGQLRSLSHISHRCATLHGTTKARWESGERW